MGVMELYLASPKSLVMIDEPLAAVWLGAVLAVPENVWSAVKVFAVEVDIPASSSLPVMGLKT